MENLSNSLIYFIFLSFLGNLKKMESNKDEASKCISIAKTALSSGDYTKALRFAEKSIRLYPTSHGEQLVTLIKKNSNNNEPKKHTTTSTSKPQQQKQSIPEPAQERKYTIEQVRAVKTILACGRDYYKVLSVEKTATDSQIKKAYRKVNLFIIIINLNTILINIIVASLTIPPR
jgi:hypothetical protein